MCTCHLFHQEWGDVTCDRVAFREQVMCCLQVHTLHDKLVLCQALDVTALTAQQVEDAADEQDCGIVADSDSDVMQTYVDQKATISVGLCILHEIFAALKALDGGFTGCVDTTVNIYYLKVQTSFALRHACST